MRYIPAGTPPASSGAAGNTARGISRDRDHDLRADNTAHYDRESSTSAPQIFEGTWTQVVDDVKLTLAVPDGQGGTAHVNVFLKQLPGRALGGPL